MSGKERAAKLNKVAELLGERSERFAEMEVRDGGGTIKKATFADVPGAQGAFQWFARLAEEEPNEIELEGTPFPPSTNFVEYEPYGVRHRGHPVELPADHGVLEDRSGPGHRQLLGDQAGVVHLHHRLDAG